MLLCLATTPAYAEYDPQKAFEEAEARARAGENAEAARIYQTILSNRPDLHRARLELAVAYYRLQELNKAREEAEKVLNDPATPEKVKIKIRNFLANVKAAGPAHKWTPYLSVGWINDDNVNVGPGGDSFVIGSNTYRSPGASAKADNGITLYAGIDHQYMFPKTYGFGERVLNFIWQSQASFYDIDLFEENDYDLEVLHLSTGPAFTAEDGWRANMSLQADISQLGHDRYATFVGLNPSVTWPVKTRNTEMTVDVLVQDRKYHQDEDDGRDSTFSIGTVSINHIFANDKWSVQGGLSLLLENADAGWYSNDGYEVYVGINRRYRKANVYARYAYLDLDYDEDVPVFNQTRHEDTDTLLLGFNYLLSSGWLNKWSVTGNYQYTDTDSNINFYDYDRNQVELAIERTF
jgi:hypothetical protein